MRGVHRAWGGTVRSGANTRAQASCLLPQDSLPFTWGSAETRAQPPIPRASLGCGDRCRGRCLEFCSASSVPFKGRTPPIPVGFRSCGFGDSDRVLPALPAPSSLHTRPTPVANLGSQCPSLPPGPRVSPQLRHPESGSGVKASSASFVFLFSIYHCFGKFLL